ncbi:unnamed protein product [Clavelina lepadiformis]|uniref:Uncharacterized protein n=1 Tax=Clavelina lepadiformis TaxID=159417 RepID=A0ABP0FS05_CLALP
MDIASSYEYETRGWVEGTHTTVEKSENVDQQAAGSNQRAAEHCGRGGVVKATDSKSVGPSPRTFKSRRESRYYFCNFIWILHLHMNMKPGGGWRVLILQWKNRRTSIDKLQVQTSEPQSDEPTTV